MRRKMRFGSLVMNAKASFITADRIVRKTCGFSVARVWNDLYAYLDLYVGKVRVMQVWSVG